MVMWLLLFSAYVLHIGFAILEMDPFEPPSLLKIVIRQKPWVGSWPDEKSCESATDFDPAMARKLTSTITRNAGAYNVIMALGFLWCWFPGVLGFPADNQSVAAIRSFFFGGALWAGLVGGYTLSKKAYLQALLGAAGLTCIWILGW